MCPPPVRIPAEVTPEEAPPYFERYRYTAFPLTDRDRRAVGPITLDWMQRARRSDCASARPGVHAGRLSPAPGGPAGQPADLCTEGIRAGLKPFAHSSCTSPVLISFGVVFTALGLRNFRRRLLV
jgi:hypothetical protein